MLSATMPALQPSLERGRRVGSRYPMPLGPTFTMHPCLPCACLVAQCCTWSHNITASLFFRAEGGGSELHLTRRHDHSDIYVALPARRKHPLQVARQSVHMNGLREGV
jgi:hypothetical protein